MSTQDKPNNKKKQNVQDKYWNPYLQRERQIPSKHTRLRGQIMEPIEPFCNANKSICKQPHNHSVSKPPPTQSTVTLLNLQYTARADRMARKMYKERESNPSSACLSEPVQSLKWKGMKEWEERGKDREHMVYGDLVSFPLSSSPPFPLISHTWDHYSSWNQHPTKTPLSLISSRSSSPIHMLSSLCHLFSLCLFYNLLHFFPVIMMSY